MAFAFRSDVPILDLGPRPHERIPIGEREYVLWPALAYRVVAPDNNANELNFLQHAVLGLCGAGCRSAELIANHLHIHPQLALLILEELQLRALIDRDGKTGRNGKASQGRETSRPDRMIAGWVFQDPWSGELWPRFASKLNYCQTESEDDSFAHLIFGSTGKPWQRRAFKQMPPPECAWPQPTSLQVLRVADLHRRALKRTQDTEEAIDEEFSNPASTTSISRISLIEPGPRPVFLMTFLYTPHTKTATTDWYVCEPFGFSPSAKFRRAVEARLGDSRGLTATLERLLRKSVHEDWDGYRAWRERLRATAELRVELHLTIEARTLTAYEHLVEMEMALEEAAEDTSEYAMRRIGIACRSVLEAVFQDVAMRHPLRGISDGLYSRGVPINERGYLWDRYRRAAATVGFGGQLPQALLNVKPQHIRSVAEYNNGWRLRAAIVATLLLAARSENHPLRSAAQMVPNLLVELDAVASLSGEAAHSGDSEHTLEELRSAVGKVYTAVTALTSGLAN
jgi:hypothetical protein